MRDEHNKWAMGKYGIVVDEPPANSGHRNDHIFIRHPSNNSPKHKASIEEGRQELTASIH
jgi:hypothetical protein